MGFAVLTSDRVLEPKTGKIKVVSFDDPYKLQRFIDVQNPVYKDVCAELRAGRKQSHWIWFIFPQLKGLGYSMMATTYGISSREEAVAYLEHPILGPRLIECTEIVNATEGRSITAILGSPDDVKFKSSMTLFGLANPKNPVFKAALRKYFAGEPGRANRGKPVILREDSRSLWYTMRRPWP